MRVAIISHTYVVTANRGKVEELARIPDLQVLCIVPKRWRNRDIGQRFVAESASGNAATIASITSWSLGSGSLITYSPLALYLALRQFRPDLVQLEEEPWSLAALEVAVISRLLHVPLGLFTWENSARRRSFVFRWIQHFAISQARLVIAGNAEGKTRLETGGLTRRVRVLPQLGVDTQAFTPPRYSGAPRDVVGYVGRLVEQKGILVLLEAIAMLPFGRLMVVGAGPLRGRVLSRSRELGLEARMELHENVRHRDVPQYLRRMTILVLPSLTTSRWKEQFGHVLIEAMASGVTVVGTNSGAIPEVIGDAGIIVPEGDAKALAGALRDLLEDEWRRVTLASKGVVRARNEYSNEVVAARLAEHWRETIAKHRRRWER